MIHISKDGSGDFTSIQQALDALPEDNKEEIILSIHKGVYEEQIAVKIPFVTLIGDGASPEDVVLTYDLSARQIMPDGQKRGTFRSYSCFIDTHDFKAVNLTLQNTAGNADKAGQALALYADGDRLHFQNCRFISGQDTLFTGLCRQRNCSPMDLSAQSNFPGGSMAVIFMSTVI